MRPGRCCGTCARAVPSVKLGWAGGGYAGQLVTWAKDRAQPHRADRPAAR
jgi:hypothetical protein